MFKEPVSSDYRDYASFAIAAVGYAILTGKVDGLPCGHLCVSHDGRCVLCDVTHMAGNVERPLGPGSSAGRGLLCGRGSGLHEADDRPCGVSGTDDNDNRRVDGVDVPTEDKGNASRSRLPVDIRNVVDRRSLATDCGPNVERNRLGRAMKKARKAKRKSMGVDWRKKDGGDMVKQDDAPGNFWNSTSASVRQKLIDSKAKMHIAENERRERESRDKLAYYDSPEAAMHKAIAMIAYAEKQSKKENDNKVYGWAKTVATSSAESLARSTPDSVPSFDSVSEEIAASSQTSFEASLKAKDDELRDARVEFDRKLADKTKSVDQLQRELKVFNDKQAAMVEKDKHDAVVARMLELEKIASRVAKPVGTNVREARPGMKWVATDSVGEFVEIPMSYMEMFNAGMKLPVKISDNDVRATKSYIRQFGELPVSLQRALDLYDKNQKK